MKILYCINSTYNSGGMERVLMGKANYFVEKLGYSVCIVTAEQQGRENFFPFSSKIKFIDLAINYQQVNSKNKFICFSLKYFKSRLHRKRLEKILQQERPDVCISMFDKEFPFLCNIKDGSKKILEYHFSKYTKLYEASDNKLLYKLQQIRIFLWQRIIRKYDCFVVLTEEDKTAWRHLKNIIVIPNSISSIPVQHADMLQKQVCSVGRISYQKGFDMLVKAWKIVHSRYPEWHLCIVGGGDERELKKQIVKLGLSESISLMPPTSKIGDIYLNSSVYAMSSRYEGFGMVLIEAMSYGLPIVSFACPCGPKDILREDFGRLVPLNDINTFADGLMYWIADVNRRKEAGAKARKSVEHFLETAVMNKWQELFLSLK